MIVIVSSCCGLIVAARICLVCAIVRIHHLTLTLTLQTVDICIFSLSMHAFEPF